MKKKVLAAATIIGQSSHSRIPTTTTTTRMGSQSDTMSLRRAFFLCNDGRASKDPVRLLLCVHGWTCGGGGCGRVVSHPYSWLGNRRYTLSTPSSTRTIVLSVVAKLESSLFDMQCRHGFHLSSSTSPSYQIPSHFRTVGLLCVFTKSPPPHRMCVLKAFCERLLWP